MFCCLGAIAGIVVGAFTGLGFWLLPVGIGLGLIADIKVLRESKKKEEPKEGKSSTDLSSICCWLPIRKKRKKVKEDITNYE